MVSVCWALTVLRLPAAARHLHSLREMLEGDAICWTTFLGGIPPPTAMSEASDHERNTLLSSEKLHRQLLSSDNNADPVVTRRDICNQLCGLLDQTWEEDTSGATVMPQSSKSICLSFWGVLRLIVHDFALFSPHMPDVLSMKQLRIHMTAALLRANTGAVNATQVFASWFCFSYRAMEIEFVEFFISVTGVDGNGV